MKMTAFLLPCVLFLAGTGAAWGACRNSDQAAVCNLCRQIPHGQVFAADCCHDKGAFIACEACMKSPSACEDSRKKYFGHLYSQIGDLSKRADWEDFENPDWAYQYPPERRAKFFLGRRSAGDMEKKSHVFLGKRTYDGSDYVPEADQSWDGENKRGRAFLGKRDVSKRSIEKLTNYQMLKSIRDRELTRRAHYSVGKRDSED